MCGCKIWSIAAVLLVVEFVAMAKPVAEVPESDWNFGTLVQGQQTNRVFTVRNMGDTTLKLLTVRGTCSACITVGYDKSTLLPGELAAITVSFDSKAESGQQEKAVLIQTNDPDHPLVRIRITGEVQKRDTALLSVEPKTVDIGVVPPSGETTISLVVSNAGSKDLVIQDIGTSSRCRVVDTAHEPLPAGAYTRIRLKFEAGNEAGVVEEYAAIRSNDPLSATTFVTIRGYAADVAMHGVDGGIVIRPVGDPVRVSGGSKVFRTRYEVMNGLASPVSLDLPTATGNRATRSLNVERKASAIFDVPADAIEAGEVSVTIRLPAAQDAR